MVKEVHLSSIDMGRVLRVLRRQAREWPVPAIGNYAQTPFTVLISCILSLRTQDRTTIAASDRLFAIARTPRDMLATPSGVIRHAIYPVSFYRVKTGTIHRICDQLLTQFGGQVPSEMDDLLSLHGVGRKTANIVLTLAYQKHGIAVDTHVHRISNRLGFVRTKTPEQTEMALRSKLPRRYWITLNDLFVALGQNVCKPISPRCSECGIEAFCAKVAVVRRR